MPDLGPKKIATLHAALGISTVAELEAACRAGRVRGVKGFGARTEQNLLESLARRERSARRVLLSDALELGPGSFCATSIPSRPIESTWRGRRAPTLALRRNEQVAGCRGYEHSASD